MQAYGRGIFPAGFSPVQPWVDGLRFGSAPGVANAMLSNSLRVEKIPGGYTVRDATDRVLVRVYGQDEPIEGGVAAITLDEAEEMALTIAMLPQTLSESEKLHLRLESGPL
jgi:hypothetical protein